MENVFVTDWSVPNEQLRNWPYSRPFINVRLFRGTVTRLTKMDNLRALQKWSQIIVIARWLRASSALAQISTWTPGWTVGFWKSRIRTQIVTKVLHKYCRLCWSSVLPGHAVVLPYFRSDLGWSKASKRWFLQFALITLMFGEVLVWF